MKPQMNTVVPIFICGFDLGVRGHWEPVMGRLIRLEGYQPQAGSLCHSRLLKAGAAEGGAMKPRWDAGIAVRAIVGAQLRCAVLIYTCALDVAAAWLDAAHQVAVSWRQP